MPFQARLRRAWTERVKAFREETLLDKLGGGLHLQPSRLVWKDQMSLLLLSFEDDRPRLVSPCGWSFAVFDCVQNQSPILLWGGAVECKR